jgi:putative membrane protein
MRKAIVLAAACALVAWPAMAQSVSTDEFVKKVAISDMFEVQSSQMALDKNPDKDTKPFAQKMVKDHTKTSKELKGLVDGGKVRATLPTALDAEHQAKLDQLKGLSGKDFDTAYDKAQLEGHQQAVALFENYSKSGDNADLKKWAAKTLPHLKQHLKMAEKLK